MSARHHHAVNNRHYFVPHPELQLRPQDPAGPRAVGQVQRARHQVHHQGGGVRQASAWFHWPDHRRPDHSAEDCLPGHPGTFMHFPK